MKLFVGALAGAIGLVFTGAGGAGASHSPSYVALGDSVAVGATLANPGTDGYVALVEEHVKIVVAPGLADEAPGSYHGSAVSGVNLAVSGETTSSMLAGQLPAAAALIAKQNQNNNPADDVRVITLDIGGNDAFTVVPACVGGPTQNCQLAVATALNTFGTNLQVILGSLRAAAGPDTEIVVMTYFNPLRGKGCYLHPYESLGDEILEGGVFVTTGMNDIIRGVAQVYGVEVAEAAGLLEAGDLTSDCLHPNANGHAKIAAAFNAVIGD